MPPTLPAIAGADGCPGGWVRVLRNAGGQIRVDFFRDVVSLLAASRACGVLGVDLPIGLADDGPRTCDVETRRLLGVRGASVFPAPVRAVLEASDYAEACARSEAACGKRVSRQLFNILPRIREMDAVLRADPRRARRVHEVHPELSFAMMNRGRPLALSKRTPEGRRLRQRLLQRALGAVFERLRGEVDHRQVRDDDLLDALAVLWSAGRIARGEALVVPPGEPRDAVGLPMVIRA